jgi:hypothetical protein
MNNLSDNKIIIDHLSCDSFGSYYSDQECYKHIIKNDTKIKKHSFVNKMLAECANDIIKNKKPKYINKSKIINKTNKILESSYENYQQSLKTYYDDVLTWINELYGDHSSSVMKLKPKKITLNEDTFNTYNLIINKYKLNQDLFNVDKFQIDDYHDRTEIFKIANILADNLLKKIGYKLFIYKQNEKIKIIVKNIFNYV